MPPLIEMDLCLACGLCQDSCPLDVIYMSPEGDEPVIRYPEECWHCGSCRQECPEGAIRIVFPLPAMVPAGVIPY